MTKEIPAMPKGYDPDATLIVTRGFHDSHALEVGIAPEGKPNFYSFWTAESLASQERWNNSAPAYDEKLWPRPDAHLDAAGRHSYKAVVGIVAFPDRASKNAALELVKGIKEGGERDDGVVTHVASDNGTSLNANWARVASAPGASVIYDQVEGAMERLVVPRREDLTPDAYAAWQRNAANTANLQAMPANATIYFSKDGLFAAIYADSTKTEPQYGPAEGRAFAKIQGGVSADGSLHMSAGADYPKGMTEQHEVAIMEGAARETRAHFDPSHGGSVVATPAMNVRPGFARDFEALKAMTGTAGERALPTSLHIVAHSSYETFNQRGDERLEPQGHSVFMPASDKADPRQEIATASTKRDGEHWTTIGRIDFKDNAALMRAFGAQAARPEAVSASDGLIGVRVWGDARENVNAILAADPSAKFTAAGGREATAISLPADKDGKPMLVVTKAEVEDAVASIKSGISAKTDAGVVLEVLSSAIAQPQWVKDAKGQMRPTGETQSGLAALESLRDGFGSNAHRKLTLDKGRIAAIQAKDSWMIDKSFMAAAERAASASAARHEAFVAAKATAKRPEKGASR